MKRTNGAGTVYLRGSTYWISYRVEGRRYAESAETGDRRMALSRLAAVKQAIAEGSWTPPGSREAPEVLTFGRYWSDWLSRRKHLAKYDAECAWGERHFVPALGEMPLINIKRSHVRDVVETVKTSKIENGWKKGQALAPRSILHVYTALRACFSDAMRDEHIPSSPCTLSARRGEIPTKKDSNEAFRREAVYTADEASALIYADAIPWDRRIYNALLFFTGGRAQEIAALRWSDILPAAPLSRLLIVKQSKEGKEAETKTGDRREIPVHADLAAILDAWRTEGWALTYGRDPNDNDLIVPTREGNARGLATYRGLKRDQQRVGITRKVPHTRHATRATYISLLREAGADRDIVRSTTHAAASDVFSGYSRFSWPTVCREVSKLAIPRPAVALASTGTDGPGYSSGYTGPERPAKTPRTSGPQPPSLRWPRSRSCELDHRARGNARQRIRR